MNKYREWSKWFAKQFKSTVFQGGYEAACDWPGCPITAHRLGMIGRGEAPLSVEAAMALCDQWDMAWLLRALADVVGGRQQVGDLQKLAHKDVYDSSDLSREIETALEDGRLTSGEIHDIQTRAATNLENASDISRRAQLLKSGPVEDGGDTHG